MQEFDPALEWSVILLALGQRSKVYANSEHAQASACAWSAKMHTWSVSPLRMSFTSVEADRACALAFSSRCAADGNVFR